MAFNPVTRRNITPAQDFETLTVMIKHIVFYNPDDGSIIVSAKGQVGETIALLGRYVCEDPKRELKNVNVTVQGRRRLHPKYGEQFHFNTLTINENKLRYFLSKFVKGLGDKKTDELIRHYGEKELERILEEEPEKLLEFKGIKSKRLERILADREKNENKRLISDLLAPADPTGEFIEKVRAHFKDIPDYVDQIRNNPYLLTSVKGLGFKKADIIARALGISMDSPFRTKSCIEYVLVEMADGDGHSAVNRDTLYGQVLDELKLNPDDPPPVDPETFLSMIHELKKEDVLHNAGGESHVALKLYSVSERYIIDDIRKRAANPGITLMKDIEGYIARKEQQMGIRFSHDQKKAIMDMNTGKHVFVLCGYAGTGKSTIARALLDMLERRYGRNSIMCCALSGIASDRIRKTSGYQAATIHSLIASYRGEQRGMPYNVVLIDEASMVNSTLLYSFMRNIKKDAHVIFVGDPAQLPPIGAGNPFADIIEFGIAPVSVLDVIHRQDDKAALTTFANQIRQNTVPTGYQEKVYKDFSWVDHTIPEYYQLKRQLFDREINDIRQRNHEAILSSIRGIAMKAKQRLDQALENDDLMKYISFFQVISPMKGGLLGTESLNEELRKILNPEPSPAPAVMPGGSNGAVTGITQSTESTVSADAGKPDAKETQEPSWKGFVPRINDKVVHTKNEIMFCYEESAVKRKGFKGLSEGDVDMRKVYNGMLGVVRRIDNEKGRVFVYYPGDEIYVEYEKQNLHKILQPAYAMTIHKVQGSEFDAVVVPVINSHYKMLNNKLLYTAITRAKGKAILIGETYAFNHACKNRDEAMRNTVMQRVLERENESMLFNPAGI